VSYYNNTDSMKTFYRIRKDQSSLFYDRYFGVEFQSFPNVYTAYNEWNNQLFENDKVITFGSGQACRVSWNLTQVDQSCAGNILVYNGFAYFQYRLNLAIKQVYFLDFNGDISH
jgi:hypothetical protein